jgi:hypothetical protein
MADITIDSFMTDVDNISTKLLANPIYADAKATIVDQLDNVEISTEEKDKLLSAFLQNFATPAITLAFEHAAKVPLLNLEQQKVDAEKDEAVYKKLQALAGLHKQFGYKNASLTGLGTSTDDGLIDRQTKGFYKDQVYKIVKTFSEQAAMLAQNSVATPDWMTDVMRIGTEILSDGKMDVTVTGDPEVTTVKYNATATEPNGLDQVP